MILWVGARSHSRTVFERYDEMSAFADTSHVGRCAMIMKLNMNEPRNDTAARGHTSKFFSSYNCFFFVEFFFFFACCEFVSWSTAFDGFTVIQLIRCIILLSLSHSTHCGGAVAPLIRVLGTYMQWHICVFNGLTLMNCVKHIIVGSWKIDSMKYQIHTKNGVHPWRGNNTRNTERILTNVVIISHSSVFFFAIISRVLHFIIACIGINHYPVWQSILISVNAIYVFFHVLESNQFCCCCCCCPTIVFLSSSQIVSHFYLNDLMNLWFSYISFFFLVLFVHFYYY